MKTFAVISVLLALVCATARPAHAAPDDPHAVVENVAADLTGYWRTTLTAQVAAYEGPKSIVYYSRPIQTPCGSSTMNNARYCPGDDAVYLDETWIDDLLVADNYTPIAILAHEWGHEVQNELGTLDRSSERAYLRALELQADCFAGLFLRSERDRGSIDDNAVADARRFFRSAGDPNPRLRSHGTGPQRVAWFNAGYSSAAYGTCAAVFQKERAMPRVPEQ